MSALRKQFSRSIHRLHRSTGAAVHITGSYKKVARTMKTVAVRELKKKSRATEPTE